MDHHEQLIGAVVSLIALCGLLIRFVLKRKTKGEAQDDSSKRLARLRDEQDKEREKRLHQHFRDYREFAESVRGTMRDLGFRATEMEKDVAELKARVEHGERSHADHREQIIERLTKMETAAKTLAQIALDTRHEITLFGEK